MNIVTKFDINDICCFMRENIIQQGKIDRIFITANNENKFIRYSFKNYNPLFEVEESLLFESKEDLINSLKGD